MTEWTTRESEITKELGILRISKSIIAMPDCPTSNFIASQRITLV